MNKLLILTSFYVLKSSLRFRAIFFLLSLSRYTAPSVRWHSRYFAWPTILPWIKLVTILMKGKFKNLPNSQSKLRSMKKRKSGLDKPLSNFPRLLQSFIQNKPAKGFLTLDRRVDIWLNFTVLIRNYSCKTSQILCLKLSKMIWLNRRA